MDLSIVGETLVTQDGVISRAQLLEAGAKRHDIKRWLRRKDLTRVLPGVYVTHTGPLTWTQQAWVATLWAAPAALALTSAVRAAGGRPSLLPGGRNDGLPIHVVVPAGRHLSPPDWIAVHQRQNVEETVRWSASPPRQRDEDAAIDLAVAHLASESSRAHLNAVASLAEPLQARRTTAPRMFAAVDRRARLAGRTWIIGVIRDVATGATTVLERGYVRRVQRPHGLPPAQLQAAERTLSGGVARDAILFGAIIELDGRAFHQGSRQRDRDLERDLDAALTGRSTTRLGWGQVFDRPCVTAGKVAALAARNGWIGTPQPCGLQCPAPATFARAA